MFEIVPRKEPSQIMLWLTPLLAVALTMLAGLALFSVLGKDPVAKSGKTLAALMFTDIVGSVDLQQRLGTDAYTRFVARHDTIFKSCLAECDDSAILNETGDGFLVRFSDPAEAVNTALMDESNIVGGYDLGTYHPSMERHMLIAVTETNPRSEIDRLVEALRRITA